MTSPPNTPQESPCAAARIAVLGAEDNVRELVVSGLAAHGFEVEAGDAAILRPDPVAAILAVGLGSRVRVDDLAAFQHRTDSTTAPVVAIGVEPALIADRCLLAELGVQAYIRPSESISYVATRVADLVRTAPERRASARVPISWAASLIVRGRRSKGRATTLSAGGIGLRTLDCLEPNEDVDVILRLPIDPGASQRRLPGRVIYCHKAHDGEVFQSGLFFYPLPDRDREAVDYQLASLVRSPGVA